MTAIATGGVGDADKGWRAALRHALGDVAQNKLIKSRSLPEKAGPVAQTTLLLFED